MTIELQRKRIKDMDQNIDQLFSQFCKRKIDEVAKSTSDAIEGAKILKWLNGIMPVDENWDVDLIGDIEVGIPRKAVKRVVRLLTEEGLVLGDATYVLACKDIQGREQVKVTRVVKGIKEGYEAPAAVRACVDRLEIAWIAPYKGGYKCKIVESNLVHRSLVCNK